MAIHVGTGDEFRNIHRSLGFAQEQTPIEVVSPVLHIVTVTV